MSTHSKKMQDCLPSSPAGIANVDGHEHQRRPSKKKEGKKAARTKEPQQPRTAQKSKMKQPSISRALRRADVLAAVKSAPKRKRSTIAPDSCGKPGEPHDLEGGALVSRNSCISKKRRRELDARCLAQALTEPGSSQAHAEIHPVD